MASSLLLPAAAAGVSGFLSGRKSARKGTTAGTTTGVQNLTGTTAGTTTGTTAGTTAGTVLPIEPAGYQGLGNLLRQRAIQRLFSSRDTSGLETQGIQNINDAYRNVGTGLNANLTSRGLGTSPMAGNAQTQLQFGRAGSIADWLNQLPEIQRQREAEDFGLANTLYAQRPLGTTTTGTQTGSTTGTTTGTTTNAGTTSGTTTGTTIEPGPGPVAGAGGSIAEVLGYQTGMGLLKVGAPAVAAGLGLAGGAAAGIPLGSTAAATAAGSLLPSAASTVPTTIGIGAPAAPGGTILGAFLSSPITWAAAGALGIGLLVRHAQTHHKADEWVQGVQNPFDQQMNGIQQKVTAGELTADQATELRKAAVNDYANAMRTFSAKGSDQSLVVRQAQDTFRRFYGDPGQYGASF